MKTNAITLSTTVVVGPDPVSSNVGGETVILAPSSGTYYGLDGVGTRIWELIQKPITVEQMRDLLLAEYEVEPDHCEQDLLALLQKLVRAGLVEMIRPGSNVAE